MNRPQRKLTRRAILSILGGATLIGGGAVAGYASWIEPHWTEVTCQPMPLANLPDHWLGKRIVQISDLHVGPIVDSDYLKSTLQSLATLKPDLLVITGDFMTCHEFEQLDQTLRLLKHLPQTPFGCYAVLGNHDYGEHFSHSQVADQLTRELANLNIEVLRNSSKNVSGLQLLGVDDYWGQNFDLEKTLRCYKPDAPSILLCHNPDVVDLFNGQQFQGWILSGHTHGGQCRLPFGSPPILPIRNKRYAAGHIDLADGRQLWVNRGLGYLRKVRWNVRPEITLFELTNGNSDFL